MLNFTIKMYRAHKVSVLQINGIARHPNLKVFHLGHFDHGDSQCDENLEEYPPKGL